jgi:hypothetical protein
MESIMAQRKAKAPTVANTTVDLNVMMANARNELHMSKDRAMHAAAQCYMIWVETQSTAGKAWFDDKVKHANEVIDAFNKGVDKDRKEVADFKAGDLKSTHEALYEGNDPEALKLKADALARINANGKLIDENRAPKKKVKIEKTKNSNEFTMVVKLVFGFTEAKDASLASRYATVCGLLQEKFKDTTALDVATIVAFLDAAGGFEVSLRQQVKAKQAGKSGVNADDMKAMTDKAKAENKAAVENMQPLSRFAMSVKTKIDGYTVLLARTNGEIVEVVGEAPVTKDQIAKMATAFESPSSNSHPATNFVQRVLFLGDLVGGVVGLPSEGKKQRKLVLRSDMDGKTQIMVSLQGSSANVVVHAVPNETVKIGHVPGMVFLPHETLQLLLDRLNDELYRRFTAIEPDTAPTIKGGAKATSKLAWHLVNSALVDVNGLSKRETLYWSRFGANSETPIDVEAMNVKTRLIVSRDALDCYWDEVLSKVAGYKAAEKKTKVATLKYERGTLLLDVPAKENAEQQVAADVDAAVKLDFRCSDLAQLVEKLKGLMVDQFVFEFDENGLMAVTWTDQLGTYSIFQPTVMDGGQLNPKRLAKASPMPVVNIIATLATKKPAAKVNRVAAEQIVAATTKRAPTKKAKAA